MAASEPNLFSPLDIRGIRLKNRLMVSPMCQYRSVDGGPVDWHMVHIGQFAIGGAGLVFHEETAVNPEGRKTRHCAGLYSEDHVDAYRRINRFVSEQGAVAALQLGHAGRKGSNAGAMHDWRPLNEADRANGLEPWECFSASNVPHAADWPAPTPMTKAHIQACIDDWVVATKRADDAEFDVLEIHAAHGYLIHQFLSPLSNQRSDEYGGSRQNRMRLAIEVSHAVRQAWPVNKPLFVRLSCVDGEGGVWNLDDSVALARELKQIGVDVIDCSSGGITGTSDMPQVRRVPGYQVGFAERIKSEADIATIAVGMITEAPQAEAILQNAQADIVAMAQELMVNPGWPMQAARQLNVDDPWAVHPPDYAFRLRRRHSLAQGLIAASTDTVDPVLERLVSTRTPDDN